MLVLQVLRVLRVPQARAADSAVARAVRLPRAIPMRRSRRLSKVPEARSPRREPIA
jgi:hypothetical protein